MKDKIFQKMYEIVRWDYQENADLKYPCPFRGDVGAHVRKILREAETHLTTRALDDCPRCYICGTVTVQMDGGYACPECGNRQ